MPIRLPAPGRFSTKNCWPSAVEKCCASTRPTMSVPPEGGDGTMMRTGRAGYSCAKEFPKRINNRSALAHRRFCSFQGNEHVAHEARLLAAIDPVVHGVLLHDNVALPQLHDRALDVHVHFARDDDRVVDRLGAVVARRDARLVL